MSVNTPRTPEDYTEPGTVHNFEPGMTLRTPAGKLLYVEKVSDDEIRTREITENGKLVDNDRRWFDYKIELARKNFKFEKNIDTAGIRKEIERLTYLASQTN